ncbi:MAG: DUF3810 domain-containing protein [Clostridia bacterium]|nr:DUF3810 domain-containing protein [Clostridia bacterium]
MKRYRFRYKATTHPVFRIGLPVFLVSAAVLLLCLVSVPVADFVNGTVSTALRFVFAKAFDPFSFSAGEFLLILTVALLFGILLYLIFFCRSRYRARKTVSFVLGVALIVLSLCTFTLSVPYHTTELDEKLGFDTAGATSAELEETAKVMIGELNSLVGGIEFDGNGSSVMPYSLDEMSEKICQAYRTANETYDLCLNYETRIKPVTFSRAMSYLRLIGIYTFYTGESNLNVDYPDYNYPATAAHEFAHQRGIIRENEANFVAFLVCLSSEDDYIRYSGYLSTLIYVLNALYEASSSKYYATVSLLDERIRGEIHAEAVQSEQYQGTVVAEISEKANDTYLKVQGLPEGEKSYGLVVDLTVAYYRAQKE